MIVSMFYKNTLYVRLSDDEPKSEHWEGGNHYVLLPEDEFLLKIAEIEKERDAHNKAIEDKRDLKEYERLKAKFGKL